MSEAETRSGFISIVGRPNVGKSTLVNSLVGEKVAITSSRPQTTRNTIRGIVTLPDQNVQLVLIDTPGIHKPKTALGERLNRLVYGSLAEADAALFVLDATRPIGRGDRLIAERLTQAEVPVIVAVNKIDIARKEEVLAQLSEAGGWDFTAYVPLSARTADGMDPLIGELVAVCEPGPFFFDPSATSDQPDQWFASELIREKYLSRLHDELPHSLAVVVDEMETQDNGVLRIEATVYVERNSQKGMVIGKGGTVVRDVGTEARVDLEKLFGTRVFLDLRVKVEKDWQRRSDGLDRLGF